MYIRGLQTLENDDDLETTSLSFDSFFVFGLSDDTVELFFRLLRVPSS